MCIVFINVCIILQYFVYYLTSIVIVIVIVVIIIIVIVVIAFAYLLPLLSHSIFARIRKSYIHIRTRTLYTYMCVYRAT